MKEKRAETFVAPQEQDFALGPVLTFLSEWWALNHAIEKASKRMQTRIGVTAQQRVMLRVIGAFPGILPGQLARVLHLDPGTISTAIGRLEQAGLVARRRNGNDARSVALELTRRGCGLDVPDPHTIEGALARALKITPANQVDAVRGFLACFIREIEVEPETRSSVAPGRFPKREMITSRGARSRGART